VEKSLFHRWNLFLCTDSETSARSMIIRREDSLFPYKSVCKHPQKKIVWRCFSHYRVGSLQPIKRVMHSPQYTEVLWRRVVSNLEKKSANGSGIFQQDLTPCHISKIGKHFVKRKIHIFCGCFSYFGDGSLKPIEGNRALTTIYWISSKKSCSRAGKGNLDGSSIFQQDLAPWYTWRMVKIFMTE